MDQRSATRWIPCLMVFALACLTACDNDGYPPSYGSYRLNIPGSQSSARPFALPGYVVPGTTIEAPQTLEVAYGHYYRFLQNYRLDDGRVHLSAFGNMRSGLQQFLTYLEYRADYAELERTNPSAAAALLLNAFNACVIQQRLKIDFHLLLRGSYVGHAQTPFFDPNTEAECPLRGFPRAEQGMDRDRKANTVPLLALRHRIEQHINDVLNKEKPEKSMLFAALGHTATFTPNLFYKPIGWDTKTGRLTSPDGDLEMATAQYLTNPNRALLAYVPADEEKEGVRRLVSPLVARYAAAKTAGGIRPLAQVGDNETADALEKLLAQNLNMPTDDFEVVIERGPSGESVYVVEPTN